MANNLMNILAMLGGQQDPEEYKPWGAKFDPKLRPGEQGPEWSYPYRHLVEDLKGSPKLRMGSDDLSLQNLQDVLPVPPNLQEGSSESDWDPSIKYPYPNLWEEIKGRQEIASQKTGRPMISFPGQEVQESPAGFDPKDVDTLGVLSDIFSGKRTPFAGSFGGEPAPISRAYEARQARKTREAEREVWVEQKRSPTGEISDIRKDEIYRAKGLDRLGPKGERKAFIPAPEQKPDKDGAAKESPTAIAPPEEGFAIPKDNILPMKMWGMYNHQLQQAGAIAEKTGVHIDQVMKEMLSKETGASKDDVDTTIGDLTQKLHEALDRKPAWEEILMAFSLILVGMDGVSFLQRLKQENIDRANLIRNLIKDEKEYELSKEAMGVSKAKEFRTLAEKQQDKIFKRREKGASTALSAVKDLLAENWRQQEKLEYSGDQPTKDQLDQRKKLMEKNKLLRNYQQLLYGQ